MKSLLSKKTQNSNYLNIDSFALGTMSKELLSDPEVAFVVYKKIMKTEQSRLTQDRTFLTYNVRDISAYMHHTLKTPSSCEVLSMKGVGEVILYGRKSVDRTEHGNDVIFFLFLATVFGNLEVWKVIK